MQWNKSSLMLMSLLYSLREAQVLMRCPEVAAATIASVLLGLGVWDPEGNLCSTHKVYLKY